MPLLVPRPPAEPPARAGATTGTKGGGGGLFLQFFAVSCVHTSGYTSARAHIHVARIGTLRGTHVRVCSVLRESVVLCSPAIYT
eukprot:9504017-Pyramimonas_sp.AAC.1